MAQAISQVSATQSHSRKEEKLPKFNGCSEDWPLFKAEFDRSTKEYKVDNSIIIRRLREALKGDALETVSFLLPNIDNVESIMKTLEDRFGQPKFVIEGLLTKARAAPSPSVTKPEATIKFGIAVQALVASITSYKSSQYLYSIEILSTLVKKMSIEMETEWYTWLRQDTSREENLKYFSQWISIKQSVAYLVSTPTTASENTKDKDRKKKKTNHGTVSTNPKPDRKEYCVYCKIENHHVSDCRKFSALPIKEKDEFVKKNRMCFRCLKKNHTVKNCKLRMTCKVEGCRGRHHTSLHDNSRFDEVQENGEAILQDQSKSQPPSAPPATHMHYHQRSAVTDTDDEVEETLLWYAPVQLKGINGTTISVIAMFDTGAQKTLILEENVKKLSIDGRWRDLSLGWFNGQDNTDPSMTTRIEISGDFPNAKTYILKCHTVPVMNLPSQTYSASELKKKYRYLRRAPFPSLKNATPSLIIGNDNISLFLSRDYIEQSPDLPIAVKTKLGWTLAGNGEMLTGGKQGNFSIFTRKKTNNEDLSEVMSDFIAAEDCTTFKSATPMSKADVEALNILEETTIKKEGRWETSLLWKNDVLPLLSSEEMVRKRLLTMESKADKDPPFVKLYTTNFEEYISAGFLQKVKVYPNETEDKRWYLPHFFTFHPSTKPILVFDAAARSKGKSFDDFVYTGPDLLQLAVVLMRFRKHRFAISGDIKQMFHQVALRKEDRPAQTLLYREMNCNRELQLHICCFCDASEDAFATVAYVRDHARGSLSVSIIAGKEKVAKAKGMPIPRLELDAAIKGAKLKAYVEKAFGHELNFASSFLWIDSRTVMCWLTSRTGEFSQYVNNRVNLILDYSTLDQWNWINTEENVADDATRLRGSTKMSTSCRWLNGSSFLKLKENKWSRISTLPTADDSLLEKRAIINFIHEREPLRKMPLPDVKKYSTWTKLIMKTASFIRSFRFKIQKVGENNVSLADVKRAELFWVKQVQLNCFAEEIKQLLQKGTVSTKSKLYQSIPFLNENGVMVVEGRLRKCDRVPD
ncbi:uncharacterized protein LOC126892099 [Diabrotica virgifera virgifera]|uniref:Peptidase aspartic putative domain-containing protein n=1 Tax=Diabrotica virgifera virgifera TaxID=50390 RepID=A0ABM5L4Y0_DIAVI|nr:uncharacterized protein LOC126892099 [Diabrotica virgifera virgifera]